MTATLRPYARGFLKKSVVYRRAVKGARLLGWTLATLTAGATLVLVLPAVGSMIMLHGLREGAERTEETERQMARQWGFEARDALAAAAIDGELTDEEIREAIGGPIWDRQRLEDALVIRASYPPAECFSYEITLPLGPPVQVTVTELPTCPAITPGS
jgi:hypothetical protein